MRGDAPLLARIEKVAQPLEHVADSVVAGITLGPNRTPRGNPAGYLRVANVQRGRIDTSDIAQLEELARDRAKYALAARDIVMVEGHASPDQIGRCAIVSHDHAGLLYQNHLFRLRFSNVLPEFALIWLNSTYMQAYWRSRCATSSGLYTINSAMLRQVPIPVLPAPEQHRTVAAHAAFERRIGALERTLIKLRKAETAVVASALDAQHYVPLDTWLSRIEAGKSPLAEDTPARDGEWGVLKVSAVQAGWFEPAENKVLRDPEHIDPRYEVRPGDLLMTRANTEELVGLACVVREPGPRLLLSDKTLRLVPDEGSAEAEFIALTLASPAVRAQIKAAATGTSASMKNIGQEAIRALLVPDVSLAVQRQAVAGVSGTQRRVRVYKRQIAKLRTIQQGVVEDLLAGRVRLAAA